MDLIALGEIDQKAGKCSLPCFRPCQYLVASCMCLLYCMMCDPLTEFHPAACSLLLLKVLFYQLWLLIYPWFYIKYMCVYHINGVHTDQEVSWNLKLEIERDHGFGIQTCQSWNFNVSFLLRRNVQNQFTYKLLRPYAWGNPVVFTVNGMVNYVRFVLIAQSWKILESWLLEVWKLWELAYKQNSFKLFV